MTNITTLFTIYQIKCKKLYYTILLKYYKVTYIITILHITIQVYNIYIYIIDKEKVSYSYQICA